MRTAVAAFALATIACARPSAVGPAVVPPDEPRERIALVVEVEDPPPEVAPPAAPATNDQPATSPESVTKRRDPGPTVTLPEPDGTMPPPDVAPPGFAPIPAKRKKGFPGVAFKEVRMFAFDLRVSGRPICERPLDPDGSPCSTVVQPGVALNEAQTKTLLALFTKKSSWGRGSSCFLPHHGFVFYDDAGTPVAEISVCFLCDVLQSAPAIPKAKRVDEGDGYGLGPKAMTALRGLCTELGLPKCDATQPTDFDGRT
ncbi:MAG TPA: hypothetical protein VG755_09275 [Nannocystaceae bacterium]|nr:hypothetical protein [Nannocystaceae bacterium]